jgi:drug/metabolite transporter (DMT)-like permease
MIISLTFGLIFWGEYFVSPSITAIIVQGLIPVLLPLFAILYGLEKITLKYIIILVLGVSGLYFIFNISDIDTSKIYKYGIVALIIGTIFYTWGSILLKTKISSNSIIELSAYQNIIGGFFLILSSLVIELNDIKNGAYLFNNIVILSWLHLVFVGSIIGFTLYLYFLNIWGSKKVALYTFITPIIAIIIDKYILNTNLNNNEIVGISLILAGIYISLLPNKSR